MSRRFIGGIAAVATATGAYLYAWPRKEDHTWKGHIPSGVSVEPVKDGLTCGVSSIFGIARLRRMTVVKLSDGSALIWSPTCLNEEDMKKALEGTNRVSVIVAPNNMHRLDAANYRERFAPLGAVVLAPAISRKAVEERVKVDDTLENYFAARPELNVSVLPVPFKPNATIQEAMLCVPLPDGKKALLVCDVFQNFDASPYPFLGPLFRLYGVSGKDANHLQMSKGFRFMMGPGRAKFLEDLQNMCRNDPSIDTVVMCHGEPVQGNMVEILQELRSRV